MRKYIIIIILLMVPLFLFSEKVKTPNNWYVYINNDGLLDWETFYSDWDISVMKYMYVHITVHHTFNRSNEIESYLGYSKNEGSNESFSFYIPLKKIEYSIIFSSKYFIREDSYFEPDKDDITIFTLPSGYNDAVQLWNNYIREHGIMKRENILVLNENKT